MLYSNNLTDLGDQLFKDLNSLQVLLLNGNKLKCLRDGIFGGLEHLRLLSLYDNNIKSITEATFSPLKNSLQVILRQIFNFFYMYCLNLMKFVS